MTRRVPSARPIDPGLPVRDEIPRVIRDELRLVVDACDVYSSWQMRMRGTSIRRARKSLKRIRSVLDLVRGGIDENDVNHLARACRDLGRRLSPLRDRDVVRSLLGRLEEEAVGPRHRSDIRLATTVLAASEPTLVVRDHRAEEAVVAVVGEKATEVLGDLDRVDFDGVDRSLVLDRIQRQWRRGRIRFTDQFREDDVEWLHDTRKRTIRIQSSLQPLEKIRPAEVRRTIKAVKRIADALGDDHDLTVLADLVESHRTRMMDAGGIEAIESEILRRRRDLRRQAMRRGQATFRRSAEEVRDRIERWWKQAAKRSPREG